MPALVVGGVTVPVALEGVTRKNIAAGDRDRAYDGSPVSDVSDPLHELDLRTAPMAPAAATTLRGVLAGAMPVTCSGDLLGAVIDCDVEAPEEEPVKVSDGPRWVFHLILRAGA